MDKVTSDIDMPPVVAPEAPEFVKNVTGADHGPPGRPAARVRFPVDGTFPSATTQWEKRNIALEIPVWDPDDLHPVRQVLLACPHAAIRLKIYDARHCWRTRRRPSSRRRRKGKEFDGMMATIQVAPEDCTGCGLCVHACPAKDKQQPRPQGHQHGPTRSRSAPPSGRTIASSWASPSSTGRRSRLNSVKGSQLLRPLFEYSGACAGCGETPYVKLLSQLFGDRAIIANATGCSSIYGGNLPTTPWATNADGRGPAWTNSLFEDNAEFGFGFRLTIDKQTEYARELVEQLRGTSSATSWPTASCRADAADRGRHRRAARPRGRAAEPPGSLTS